MQSGHDLDQMCSKFSLRLYADQYLKAILHMYSITRSLLALERGLEWPCMLLYPSHHNLVNVLLNLDFTEYLHKQDRKTLLEVRSVCVRIAGC